MQIRRLILSNFRGVKSGQINFDGHTILIGGNRWPVCRRGYVAEARPITLAALRSQREGNRNYDLFLPILNLNVGEVWDSVFWLGAPKAIRPHVLEALYRDASGECPVIKAPTAPPCASGRFDCWTCTVVRRDKSARKLIEAGYDQLRPYFEFRNWLSEIRNDPHMRSHALGFQA